MDNDAKRADIIVRHIGQPLPLAKSDRRRPEPPPTTKGSPNASEPTQ
jgi:hypothetical protein